LYESYSTASLEAIDGILRFDISQNGIYEICCENLDEDGCSNYCCRTYCLDDELLNYDIGFRRAPDGTSYNITLDLPGVTNVSYYGGEPFVEKLGSSFFVPFPSVEDCYCTDYTFRYQEGDCWETARFQAYICNPYDCNDIVYDFDRQNESWNLSFSATDPGSITWDNEGTVPEGGAADWKLDSRPEGSCGLRNISVRYFDELNWRHYGLRFWDCNPYDCANFTTQTDEAGEPLNLIFNGSNATQVTWSDDATGQNTEDSDDGQVGVLLPWPETGCQTRFTSVRYFDSVLSINRICSIEVEVCRPGPCEEPITSFSCGNQWFYQNGINGGSDFSFSISDPAYPNLGNWRIDGNDYSGVSYASLLPDGTLECDFPVEGSYEICHLAVDEDGCEDYCCRNYCIDFVPPPEPATFEVAGDGQGCDLTFSLLGASDVSWYVPGQPGLEGDGASVNISFRVEGCFYQTYYFRYFERGCWKTAVRRVYVCNPFNCNDINVQSLTTDATGEYIFTGLRPDQSYRVVTVKDTNYQNGVTSGDLSRILQHLSRSPELVTRCKRIAVDVSSLGQITEGDISAIRQLIFRELTSFEDVSSWGFVPLAYNLSDPDSPHDPFYLDGLNFTASSVELSAQDFMGVKRGDIGDSADSEDLNGGATDWVAKSLSDLSFELSSGVPIRNQAYQVDVRANDFANLLAAQFSLGWGNSQLRFDSLSNLNEELELNDENFSTVSATSGCLAWLWFAALTVSLADSSLLFRVHFTVTGEVGEELAVFFTENPTEFSFEDTDSVLIANFTDLQRTIELPTSDRSFVAVKEWRVFSNPATKWINIATTGGGFGPERLELFDSKGRSVRNWTSTAEGKYSIAGLPTGVYQFMLSSAVGVQVSRLVVVD
jgi:hypothetical protein